MDVTYKHLETQTDAGEPWRRRAPELARWTMASLVNRTDVCGAYIAIADREKIGSDGKPLGKTYTAPGKAKRGGVYLTEYRIVAHFAARDESRVIGLHAISREETCKSVSWDIDNHGSANAAVNLAYALHLYNKLAALGFSPLLNTSDDKGGYHLRVIFASAIASSIAHYFGKWLVSDYEQHGFTDAPEVFPKQPDLSEVEFGNWMRLIGRHHTRPYWSKVYNGAEWCEGNAAIDIIVAKAGDNPALIPAEAAPPAPRKRPPTIPRTQAFSTLPMQIDSNVPEPMWRRCPRA